jgi:hypothetical protein
MLGEMRRSRLDRRERALSAEQGRDSAEVNARQKQCFGLDSTEGEARFAWYIPSIWLEQAH